MEQLTDYEKKKLAEYLYVGSMRLGSLDLTETKVIAKKLDVLAELEGMEQSWKEVAPFLQQLFQPDFMKKKNKDE